MEDRSLDDFVGSDDESTDGSVERGDERDTTGGESESPDTERKDGDNDAGATDDSEPADAEDDPGENEQGVRVDPDQVDPAVATYTWSDAGGPCAACGESVDRRWRQDEQLVCPDCKEW